MISTLSQTFGSNTKAQEILFVIHDLKLVARQGFYDQELPAIEQFCQEHNLSLVCAPYKVVLSEEQGYSNKGFKAPKDHPTPGMIFTYIAKDKKQAQLACYHETVGNHQQLGELLGYPECCINFFIKNFSSNNPNPQLQPTNPWTNITQREKDSVLLSHFPCNSECEQSILQAKKYFELLKKQDSCHAQELISNLTI